MCVCVVDLIVCSLDEKGHKAVMLAPDLVHGSKPRAETGPWPPLPPFMKRLFREEVLSQRTREEQDIMVLVQELLQSPRLFQSSSVLGLGPLSLMPAVSREPNESIGPVQGPTLNSLLGGYKALGLDHGDMMRVCNKHFWDSVSVHWGRLDVLKRHNLDHVANPTEMGVFILKDLKGTLDELLKKVHRHYPLTVSLPRKKTKVFVAGAQSAGTESKAVGGGAKSWARLVVSGSGVVAGRAVPATELAVKDSAAQWVAEVAVVAAEGAAGATEAA